MNEQFLHRHTKRPLFFPFSPFFFFPLCACFVFCSLLPSLCLAEDTRKVVVPFDFVSKFDDGRYGQILGEMFWKKLSREGGFIIPETMLDVREYCRTHNLQPTPDMDIEKMRKIVQDDFGAQIGIWGSVERVPGTELDAYDVVIKCVDFSDKQNPKVVAEVKGSTKTVSEIPNVYVKQVLDSLYERPSGGSAGPDALAEENWSKNPNLITGDFEHGSGGVPKGWEKVCAQERVPLGKQVRWMPEEGNSGNRVIHFNLDKDTAELYGLMYYCETFPVEEGAKYRFQVRWRSKGPAVKVFLKCYGEENSEYRAESGKSGSSSTAKLGKDDYLPASKERREVYRSQQNLSTPTNSWTWKTHTEDFTPKHVKYSPKSCRIMLYAYMVPGVVEFDDVVVKQIVPVSPGEQANKVRRHSKETKITVKEMEENERRSKEMKAQKSDE